MLQQQNPANSVGKVNSHSHYVKMDAHLAVPGDFAECAANAAADAAASMSLLLLTASEIHYTETFRNNDEGGVATVAEQQRQHQQMKRRQTIQQQKLDECGLHNHCTVHNNIPLVSTRVLINFMNSLLNSAKSTLQGQGMAVYYDQNGKPIDYSSRPIDAIFRRAREELSNSNGTVVSGINIVVHGNFNTGTALTNPASGRACTTQTTAASGDLDVLSRVCLNAISSANAAACGFGCASVGVAQQFAVKQSMPLTSNQYPCGFTQKQLQQLHQQNQMQQQQQLDVGGKTVTTAETDAIREDRVQQLDTNLEAEGPAKQLMKTASSSGHSPKDLKMENVWESSIAGCGATHPVTDVAQPKQRRVDSLPRYYAQRKRQGWQMQSAHKDLLSAAANDSLSTMQIEGGTMYGGGSALGQTTEWHASVNWPADVSSSAHAAVNKLPCCSDDLLLQLMDTYLL